jgi:hypothetical protein
MLEKNPKNSILNDAIISGSISVEPSEIYDKKAEYEIQRMGKGTLEERKAEGDFERDEKFRNSVSKLIRIALWVLVAGFLLGFMIWLMHYLECLNWSNKSCLFLKQDKLDEMQGWGVKILIAGAAYAAAYFKKRLD